jgi:hypothetical protein
VPLRPPTPCGLPPAAMREREREFWAKWRREERNQAAQTDREKNL